MIGVDEHIIEQNEEQLDELLFVIEKRSTPTIVFITCDGENIKKEYYQKIVQKNNYKNIKFDVENLPINSLSLYLKTVLDKSILTSEEITHAVHVFGIEDSIVGANNEGLIVKDLANSINLERELLFRGFPIILFIWTNELAIKFLRKQADDFWSWVTDYYQFVGPEIYDVSDFYDDYHYEGYRGDKIIEYKKELEKLNNRLKSITHLRNEKAILEKLNTLKSIGLIYQATSKHDKAIYYFKRCIDLSRQIKHKMDRDVIDFHIFLAQSYSKLEQFIKAKAELEYFLEVKNNISKAEIYLEYGKVLEKAKDIKSAADYFANSIKLLQNAQE